MPNRYVSLEDLADYGQVNEGDDVTFLQTAIEWAESSFERYTGSQFSAATRAEKVPLLAFVDKYGWLHLISRTLAPVTDVLTVTLRYYDGWFNGPLSWQADNLILPSPDMMPPTANAWEVYLLPDQQLIQAAPSQVLATWSYKGGYATVPEGLKMIILRMAWWKYKLREVPMGIISNPAFGTLKAMSLIEGIPADLQADIDLWKRKMI